MTQVNILDFSFQQLKQLGITVTLHQCLPKWCPEATPTGQIPSHIVTSAALPGSEHVYSSTSSTSHARSQKLSVRLLGGESTGQKWCSQPYRCHAEPTYVSAAHKRHWGFYKKQRFVGRFNPNVSAAPILREMKDDVQSSIRLWQWERRDPVAWQRDKSDSFSIGPRSLWKGLCTK